MKYLGALPTLKRLAVAPGQAGPVHQQQTRDDGKKKCKSEINQLKTERN